MSLCGVFLLGVNIKYKLCLLHCLAAIHWREGWYEQYYAFQLSLCKLTSAYSVFSQLSLNTMSGYAIIDPIKSTYMVWWMHDTQYVVLVCSLNVWTLQYLWPVQWFTEPTFLIARCLVCSSSQDREAILSRKPCMTLLVISAALSCELAVTGI